jgi:hypothetical protein
MLAALAWILGGFAFIVVASILTVLLIARAVYRRVRRSRTVNAGALRARAAMSWGSQRTVLQLRLRLGAALDSGQAAIDLLPRVNGPTGDLPRLFRRIRVEAERVDAQLRFLESENESAVLERWLTVMRGRVEQVVSLVGRLRSAVSAGLDGLGSDALNGLQADVEREIAALHAGLKQFQTLYADDAAFEDLGRPAPVHPQARNT